MNHMYYENGIWRWFMPITGWILPLVIIILLFRLFSRGRSSCRPSKTPLDILNERYARGEISREEYKRMKEDLKE